MNQPQMLPRIMHFNDPFEELLFQMLFAPMPTDAEIQRIESGQVDRTTRIACRPDEVTLGTGYHKHTCRCGTSWKHDDLLPMVCEKDEFDEAHSCPTCGTEVREKDLRS